MKRIEFQFAEFPDTPISAVVSPVPMGVYFDFLDRWLVTQPLAEYRESLETFQRIAQPDPPIAELDFNLGRALVNEWLAAVREVPLPLLGAPSEPEPSPEPSSATPARPSRSRQSSRGRRPTTRSSAGIPATPSRP
jgi:hypothetical protein